MAGSTAAFARRADLNHQQMFAFIGAILGLGAFFVFFHCARRFAQRLNAGMEKPSALAVLSRAPRSLLLRKIPGLPSGGHAIIIFCYLAVNIVLTFTNIDTSSMSYNSTLASRAAWMAVANMVVVIFLALKNTPLGFLTAWSYERLNILHQVAGSTCVIFVIIHGSCYSSYFALAGRTSVLTSSSVIYGEIAGISFLILGFAGLVIRRWWYELFYYIHITFWILAVVMVGLHQPDFGEKIVIAVIFAAGLWVLDRLIRMFRLLVYSANNSAVLTPLPNGATRITLKKAPVGASSGEHSFLWIPRIRSFETHPFTIASTDPLEFVVASYDGFTRDLHKYAVAHPGATVKASVEGSYGTLPDTKEYDTVVFVAGGSGATFTFGMALNMLKNMSSEAKKKLIFIWMVKYETNLTWFESHLDSLKEDPRVQLQLYVTRPATRGQEGEVKLKTTPSVKSTETDLEKAPPVTKVRFPSSSESLESGNSISIEPESSKSNGDVVTQSDTYKSCIRQGKPDVSTLICAAVDETPVGNRVLVLGCGPKGLMTAVRNTTASCIRTNGPDVELHCEQFGW